MLKQTRVYDLSCLQYPGEQSYDLQRPGQRPHEVLSFSDPGETLTHHYPSFPNNKHCCFV